MDALHVCGIAAAVVVLVRVICLASHLSPDGWKGMLPRFVAFSVFLAAFGASAFAVAADLPFSGQALLVSVAGLIVSDRRMTR